MVNDDDDFNSSFYNEGKPCLNIYYCWFKDVNKN